MELRKGSPKTKMYHGIETASSKAKSKQPDSDLHSNAAAKLGASILECPSGPKNEGSYVSTILNINSLTDM
jgi:hypothetical protein